MRSLVVGMLFTAVALNGFSQKIGRFVNQTEIGLLTGKSSDPSFSAQTFNGIRFKEVPVETGISMGIDVYSPITLVPVSVGVKWTPLNKYPISPFLGFNAGYGFDWVQRRVENLSTSGGYFVNPTAGFRIKTQTKARISVNFGYKRQEAAITSSTQPIFVVYDDFQPYTSEEYSFKRIYAGIGLVF